jgi:hypothetical protein
MDFLEIVHEHVFGADYDGGHMASAFIHTYEHIQFALPSNGARSVSVSASRCSRV